MHIIFLTLYTCPCVALNEITPICSLNRQLHKQNFHTKKQLTHTNIYSMCDADIRTL